jgi:tRNA1Val (adenine37-N6)-methyltransferase
MMANNWFQFKKFIIRQGKTAMKVGTDGVLLGAWAPVSSCLKILDVGTGTGLVALMIAQRSGAVIDAIEIDPGAAEQAASNVLESPWSDRIRIICSSFQDFFKDIPDRYDLIVCNPPFFSDSLKAGTQQRILARHSDSLELKELIGGANKLLGPSGHLCVILPADKEKEMVSLSIDCNLFPSKILRIRPRPTMEFKRVLIDFSFSGKEIQESEMYIESGIRHQYSKEYTELTYDYYLFNPSDTDS